MPESDSPLGVASRYALAAARERLSGKRLVALTGAGISTDSGIPDYRGEGRVARHPMTFDSFMGSEAARVRYWARSFVGYSRIAEAKPNRGHLALAQAEHVGKLSAVITQNVDRLHQTAGSSEVIDLHGRLDQVRCMSCTVRFSRQEMDELLTALNPTVKKDINFEFTPDGDAEIEASEGFAVPPCPSCTGVLKPDVVFFGESVPVERAEQAMQLVTNADALLVAGSSLQVNSGMRFAKTAHRLGLELVIVNLGPTKADHLAGVKIEANTSFALEELFHD